MRAQEIPGPASRFAWSGWRPGPPREKSLAKSVRLSGPTAHWIGLDSVWYLSALIPKSAGVQLVAAKLRRAKADDPSRVGRELPSRRRHPTIAAGPGVGRRVRSSSGRRSTTG